MPVDSGGWSAGLKCFTEVTGHSPAGNVDIKFPALCKHISRNGINKGDPFPRTKQKGQWREAGGGEKDEEDGCWGGES